MNKKIESFKLKDAQIQRYEKIYDDYRNLYQNPDNCRPMFIINTPTQLSMDGYHNQPLKMLEVQLARIKQHLAIGDDCVPTVRVDFGTAQVASAFGCKMRCFPNSSPVVESPAISSAQEVFTLKKPKLDSGLYWRLKEFTDIWKENLPEGVFIAHPDIQSPFNTAHLIRGNDILLDFYDNIEAVETLLDLVTDYMTELVPYLKNMISNDKEWFFDWGALWRGAARISNCSMHMISPKMYEDYILKRDMRLLKNLGKGRIHYCGTHRQVIDCFCQNKDVVGLDIDANHHDLWELADSLPKNMVLLVWADPPEGMNPLLERLMKGDLPKKRNIIIQVNAHSIEDGRKLLAQLSKIFKG